MAAASRLRVLAGTLLVLSAAAVLILALGSDADRKEVANGGDDDGAAVASGAAGLCFERESVGGSDATPQSVRVFVAEAADVDGVGPAKVVKEPRSEDIGARSSTIYWCDEGGRLRDQRDLGSESADLGFNCSECAAAEARQQVQDGVRELGLTYARGIFGSAPQLAFALFRLGDDGWVLVWDSEALEHWRGSHGRIEFPRGDLSEFVVRSDSWFGPSDGFDGALVEANAGPHRFFVDTWFREGDTYVRRSSETVPLPYATLVEFMFALHTNDDARAQRLVTESGLVGKALDAGLDAGPGAYWSVTCGERGGLECGKTEPVRFFRGPPVAFSFVEKDGRWLISAIEPAENAR